MTQAPAMPKLAAGDAHPEPPLGALVAAVGGASSCAQAERGTTATVRARATPTAARVRKRTDEVEGMSPPGFQDGGQPYLLTRRVISPRLGRHAVSPDGDP